MTVLPEVSRFALEHAADAVMITDTDSVIRYVNAAFTRLTGYEADEVIGRKPKIQGSSATTPEDYRRIWSAVLERGWWRGEIVNRRKSGEEWTAALSISRVIDADGGLLAYVGIATDISEVKRLQERLREAGLEAIHMLAVACEAKDKTTGNHIARVRHYAWHLARELGIDEAQAEEIAYSSIMHDVGKLHVPDAVLMKPGPLADDEWKIMREHPRDGMVILRKHPFYQLAREISENHHERWDGTGYPRGRRGGEIPVAARIVSVADVFDALTTRRPYKKPWPVDEAIAEVKGLSGRAFDPDIVTAFLNLAKRGVVAGVLDQFPPDEAGDAEDAAG